MQTQSLTQQFKFSQDQEHVYIAELGNVGRMLYNLLKEHKAEMLEEMKLEETLIPTLLALQVEFHHKVIDLMSSGHTESEAKEIIYPQITAQLGF